MPLSTRQHRVDGKVGESGIVRALCNPKSGVLKSCEQWLLYVMIAVYMHNSSDEEQAFVCVNQCFVFGLTADVAEKVHSGLRDSWT